MERCAKRARVARSVIHRIPQTRRRRWMGAEVVVLMFLSARDPLDRRLRQV